MQPTTPPPVRHGRCRLSIHINGNDYSLRRKPGLGRGSKVWALKSPTGLIRCVAVVGGTVACSCPDARFRAARCKHVRALQAAGLVNPRLRFVPSATAEEVEAAAAAGKGVAS